MSLPLEIVKAYVADAILRHAFTPHSGSEKFRWLSQLHQSMREFWEVENYPDRPHEDAGNFHGVLEHGSLQLSVEYRVKPDSDIDAKITFYRENASELLWQHHADKKYYRFPERTALNKLNKEKQALREAQLIHVESAVDGLLCHPSVHQHLKSPVDRHEIRIGGGIGNAFVFLFNVLIQLCPSQEKRAQVRTRLCNRFFDDAVKRRCDIAPKDLFKNFG